MSGYEPKKLALLRILQILQKYSDPNHPLTQEDISGYLERDFGIVVERKAVGRNLSLLKEADYDIVSTRSGCYLSEREFADSELRMLIDGVLSSRYITAKHSSDLINRLCGLSNAYFRAHIKNICSVNEWHKTDNQALFYNIEIVDDAVERKKQISFDFTKYGVDKKLHKSASHIVSPYQLILHNQRYYLMAWNEQWKNISFFRMDHITNIQIIEDSTQTDIRSLDGYKNGIDYEELATQRPYMFTDKAEHVECIADEWMIDQIIEWFGYAAKVKRIREGVISVSLKASPNAMEHWAMQFANYVEIVKPESLRKRIRENLTNALNKYDERDNSESGDVE